MNYSGIVPENAIAAKSIVASKLAVADFSNLVPDGQLLDPNAWSAGTMQVNPSGPPYLSLGRIFVAPSGTETVVYSEYFPAAAGAEYLAQFQATFGESGAMEARGYLIFYDRDRVRIGNWSDTLIATVTVGSATVWTRTLTAPPDAQQARFRFVVPVANARNVYFYSPAVYRMNAGELIVDGGIQARWSAPAKSLQSRRISAKR